MSDYVIDGELLTDIADAIRKKTGESGDIIPEDMPDAISGISGGESMISKALLHFEESTTKDEYGNTWSANNAVLSSDRSKFGEKSLYLNNGNITLTQSQSSKPILQMLCDRDFTIDCWVYPVSSGRQAVFSGSIDNYFASDLFFNSNSSNIWLGSLDNFGWNLFQCDNSGSSNSGCGTLSVPINEWTHLAYVRYGNNVKTFVNGVISFNKDIPYGSVMRANSQAMIRVGQWSNNAYSFNGYIDEFRFINGEAIWTDEFTPPTEPYNL